LTNAQIVSALLSRRKQVLTCGVQPKRGRVRFEIAPNGKVKSVSATSPRRPFNQCLEDKIRAVRFPRAQKPTKVDIPLPIRRRAGGR
jgi:hypothetical protein